MEALEGFFLLKLINPGLKGGFEAPAFAKLRLTINRNNYQVLLYKNEVPTYRITSLRLSEVQGRFTVPRPSRKIFAETVKLSS